MIPRRPMTSRYQQIFLGHCYSCNNFGHKALDCKAYEKVNDYQKNFRKTKSSHQNSTHIKNLRRYENENSHYKKKYQKEFFGYCHCFHKFGHKAADYRTKAKDQSLRRKQDINTSDDRRSVSRVTHGNRWRIKLGYKYSEETNNSNVSEVSKYDEEEYNGGCLF